MIHIDHETCKACGICGHVCPRHVLETLDRENRKVTAVSPEREDLCMGCGHCAAVCPTDSIRIDGLDPRGFTPVKDLALGQDEILGLLGQRRSTRRYKAEAIPREVLDPILEAAHRAPTGTSRSSTGVIVIDRKENLKKLSEMIYRLYEGLGKALRNPIGRLMVRRKAGARTLGTLQDFVMPGMRWYIRWYREGKSDEILRDCPALMLFHGPVTEPRVEQNCTIAAFHVLLMAQVHGVGTCFNDLIPPACNRSPEIRRFLGLPSDREVYSSVTLGYPRYRFLRNISRRLAEVRYLA
jgi:nitroreductase/NAD-dependent dihydropyrimidine dehydrogenase PreA subunit